MATTSVTDATETTTNCCPVSPARRFPTGIFLSGLGGFILGAVAIAVVGISVMPSAMISTHQSPMGFDETIAAIQDGIERQGWKSPGTLNLQQSLTKAGKDVPYRVQVIQLCHPDYATDVLNSDRWVASLMPCTIAVWEDDDGQVFVSKMNTGLMGKLFGGNIARVMGGKVADDERNIMAALHE